MSDNRVFKIRFENPMIGTEFDYSLIKTNELNDYLKYVSSRYKILDIEGLEQLTDLERIVYNV